MIIANKAAKSIAIAEVKSNIKGLTNINYANMFFSIVAAACGVLLEFNRMRLKREYLTSRTN